MLKLNIKIDKTFCDQCEGWEEFQPLCRKTLHHARYQVRIAWKKLINDIDHELFITPRILKINDWLEEKLISFKEYLKEKR